MNNQTMRITATSAPLQWEHHWWAWQLLSWSITTCTAPAFWIVGILLTIDSRSDHPAFWMSLPVIVAISHAFTIVRINQLHHHQAFTSHAHIAIQYFLSGTLCCALFMIVGLLTGFLPEFIAPFIGDTQSEFVLLRSLMWYGIFAGLFGLLAFIHAGPIHAHLAFCKTTQTPSQQQLTYLSSDNAARTSNT